MYYFVTYTTIDSEFGNPFWHAFLMLSTFDETGSTTAHKVQVQDTWGFYGIPATTRDGCLSKLKIKIGLDVDLTGNHGMLQHEELRFLDLGRALHGLTFELTEPKWHDLQKKCQKMYDDQQLAVKEIADFCGLDEKPRPRIYSHEHHSQLIHSIEKSKATKEGREPRLKPFEIRLQMSTRGPTIRHSHTCKSQIMALLSDILTKEQQDRLTEYGKHPTVPRWSGPLESIHLHSEGNLRQHQKLSGHIAYYRDFKDKGTKLYWSVPPQEIISLNTKTKKVFSSPHAFVKPMKETVKKLQALEWLFIHATLPEVYLKHKLELIDVIKKHYEAFACVSEHAENNSHESRAWNVFSLFKHPNPIPQDPIEIALNKANNFLNSIYFATVDLWDIELDKEQASEENIEDVEAVAAYLSEKDKIALCKILNRSYDKSFEMKPAVMLGNK